MKNLFKNIWNAPASTIAAGICASIAVITANGKSLPEWGMITLLAVAAFLSLFSGKNTLFPPQ